MDGWQVEADLCYEPLPTGKGRSAKRVDSRLAVDGWEPIADTPSASSRIDAAGLMPDVRCGVGVVLGENEAGQVAVRELERGGAAEASFVVVRGDVLYSVDDVAVAGIDVSEASELLLGSPGSVVKLEFRRQVGWLQEDPNGARADHMLMPIVVSLQRSETAMDGADISTWKPPRPSVESFGEADTPSPELTVRDFQSSFGKMAQLASRDDGAQADIQPGGHESNLLIVASSRPSSDEVAHSDASSDLVRPTGAAAPASLAHAQSQPAI